MASSKQLRTRGPEGERRTKTKAQRTRGAPLTFTDEAVQEAAFLASNGATDIEIAEQLGITVSTLYVWYRRFPQLSEAVKRAKEFCDDRVERSYFQRAVGFTHTVEKVFSNGTRATVREHVLADTGAAANWLANRRRGEWTPRRDVSLIVPETDAANEDAEPEPRQLAIAALALLNEAAYTGDQAPMIEASANEETEDDDYETAGSSETQHEADEEAYDPDFDD